MLNARGMTILLTTHYLEEAQELCDKIAIINHGRIIVNEDKKTLVGRIDSKEIIFKLDRDVTEIPSTLMPYQARLVDARSIAVRYTAKDVAVGALIAAVQGAGLGIVDISTSESDLEDVFIQLTSNAA